MIASKPRTILSAVVAALLVASLASAEPPRADAESYTSLVTTAQAKARANEWADAAALFERSVKLNPTVADTWYQLGVAHYQTKSYRPAIAAFEKAFELGANYPFNSAYNIACCQALLGEKDRALASLERALEGGFRDLAHVRDDADLESLRGDARWKKLVGPTDPTTSRDDGWRGDLAHLAREVKRLHYDPFRKTPEAEFDAQVRKLHDEIPKLTDPQMVVGLLKIMTLAGDGHTTLRSTTESEMARSALPVDWYLFTEGLFVTAADPKHADLVGAQVLRIGDHTVDEVLQALKVVISRDNEQWPLYIGPRLARSPRVLSGLGLIPEPTRATVVVRDGKGEARTVALEANSGGLQPDWIIARKDAAAPEPLSMRAPGKPYWFEYLPDSKTVWFQWNAVANDPVELLADFATRLFKTIEEKDVARLVIDLRRNSGGNNFLNRPIVHGLIRCTKIDQKGNLFVIVGRNTFSAAMCGAAEIERHTNAIFVGEPTGSRPNFIGESVPLVLPYSGLRGSISDLYWENSVAMDYRTWIAPEIYAPPTFEAYRANRDPAWEAILAYR